jgi:hypothetical protein
MSCKQNQSTVSQSDADTATTTTRSKPRKSRSTNPNQSENFARSWPFQRVDGKMLERAHKQAQKQAIADAEPAPF